MLSIFLHKSFDPFYQTVSTFPTVIYSFLLLLCLLFWLSAMLGVVEIDILDFGSVPGADSLDVSSTTQVGGLLMKLRLNEVPLTITLSLISLIGWLLCYYAMYFSNSFIPENGALRFLWGTLVFMATLIISTLVAAVMVRPLKPLFKSINRDTPTLANLIGHEASVRTAKVTATFGEAFVNNGGAGLILQVRCEDKYQIQKNDQVVLFDYHPQQNTYQILPKEEFDRMKSNL